MWKLRLTFNSFEDETLKYLIICLEGRLAFNSFEDETCRDLSLVYYWVMYLSIPLRMKRIPVFAAGNSGPGCLSIPLRMKHQLLRQLEAEEEKVFQFLWGWNLVVSPNKGEHQILSIPLRMKRKSQSPQHSKRVLQLSIPLRMKHYKGKLEKQEVLYFQFLWGWNIGNVIC